jgi:CRP-like cAMP-binding protein
MDRSKLKGVPLFAGLDKRDLDRVARLADDLDVPDGRVLAREGDLGREFFVIEEGRAKVDRNGTHIADLGPGDFFGEIALIEEERRTATVTADGPMTVAVMTGSAFRGLRRSMPEVFERVREEIMRRRAVPS